MLVILPLLIVNKYLLVGLKQGLKPPYPEAGPGPVTTTLHVVKLLLALSFNICRAMTHEITYPDPFPIKLGNSSAPVII